MIFHQKNWVTTVTFIFLVYFLHNPSTHKIQTVPSAKKLQHTTQQSRQSSISTMDNNNPPIAPYAVEVPRPPSPQQPLNANVRAVLTAAQLAAQ